MERQPVVLAPGEGRSYDMGRRLSSVFKADGPETNGCYSISEWWLEPHTKGPGVHHHPEDDVFFVLGGTVTFWLDGREVDAAEGAFVLVPGGVGHDFFNSGDERAGFLNISTPGDFEDDMPGIAAWFRERSEQDSRC